MTQLAGLLARVDELMAVDDPPETPYVSHYRAINLLQKWLSTSTSTLETAMAQTKLGGAFLHVEEPHHAQPSLEKAGNVLYPALVNFATDVERDTTTSTTKISRIEISAILAKLPVGVQTPDMATEVDSKHVAQYQWLWQRCVLESMTQLGILWTNRSQPLRALCYFHACLHAAEAWSDSMQRAASSNPAFEPESDTEDVDGQVEVLRSVRAHASFYLAQVYGSLQHADDSARFCAATLELQLLDLTTANAGHEWVTNALGLVDFYLEREFLNAAAICLYGCEHVFTTIIIRGCDKESSSVNAADRDRENEREREQQRHGDIHLAWARLHQLTLQLANAHQDLSIDGTTPPTLTTSPSTSASSLTTPPSCQALERSLRVIAYRQQTGGRYDSADGGDDIGDDRGHATVSTPDQSYDQDNNSTLASLSSLGMRGVCPDTVMSFDAAREVFRMGLRASEAALSVFPLDGFVTQHVRVLQLQSRLYFRLLFWEQDVRRQTAMQLRRLALLSSVLRVEGSSSGFSRDTHALNPRAYCALLQELYYEAAEVAADVYDLKTRKKFTGTNTAAAEEKANAYALQAIHWYQRYLELFYSADDSQGELGSGLRGTDGLFVGGDQVRLPANGMDWGELRAVVLGFFALARVCGKVEFSLDRDKTVWFSRRALGYHDAVLTLVDQYQAESRHKQGIASENDATSNAARLKAALVAELDICREMRELLPEKINQLVYRGKAS